MAGFIKLDHKGKARKIYVGGFRFCGIHFGGLIFYVQKYDFAMRKELHKLLIEGQEIAQKDLTDETICRLLKICEEVSDKFFGEIGAYKKIMGKAANDLSCASTLLAGIKNEIDQLNAGLFEQKVKEYAPTKSKFDKNKKS
jgi:hypothetical protein